MPLALPNDITDNKNAPDLNYAAYHNGAILNGTITSLASFQNTTSNPIVLTSKPASGSGNYTAGAISVEWIASSISTFFKITGVIRTKRAIYSNRNIYFAFGISHDEKMVKENKIKNWKWVSIFCFEIKGDDDVAVCKIFNNVGFLEHYYNDGKTSYFINPDKPSNGFSNIKVTIENNVIKCSFEILKFLPNVENYFRPHEYSYYLLTASGELDANGNWIRFLIILIIYSLL